MDRPFGFSVHRDALFCLSRLFRFVTYRAFYFNKVFLDCIGIHRTYKFTIILCNLAYISFFVEYLLYPFDITVHGTRQ
ncbi:transmembrane protein, putative [Medicago truncatula]|uniref:Transmembrane protein, putative n=1 Tax=Medicago truncatula TaxID=3880 RepID=A0A072VX05_MEDTR|nr:transmembrane protein, putative [Medicago truncatula]